MVVWMGIAHFISVAFAGDFPRHFIALTDNARLVCNETSKCFITQDKNNRKYQILFDMIAEKNEQSITALKIVSIEGKTTQLYPLPVPKLVVNGDVTPLFAADINSDGFHDLALQASLSNKLGYVFYYWMYNPKSKQFVLTPEMLPALQAVKGKAISSLTSHSEFKISDSFQIIETISK